MANDAQQELVEGALDVWAPSWPRRVNRTQEWVNGPSEAAAALLSAQNQPDNSPFISTYSFPNGHTKHNNIPQIDTLFIDFDFDDGDYERGSGDREAWRRDLSHLLVRARMVAKELENGWRAALSGHKGIHLFLDFEPLPTTEGTFDEYVSGLNDFAVALIDDLADRTGLTDLQEYVDVTSSDLGRLCRVPNTIHGGATSSFGERRYCVPITIDELSRISADEYESLTQAPRAVPVGSRDHNEPIRGRIIQFIRRANSSSQTAADRSVSEMDWERVERYQEQSNDNITLDDIEFLTSDRPCVWSFYERRDKYQYGAQSHEMEIFCIRELVDKNVPIPVIKEFLSNAPEYDDDWSEQFIKEIISLGYNRYSLRTIANKAPEFIDAEQCELHRNIL